MLNQPIKLQESLNLYSGDIITINNSSPLLVEVIEDQTIKLRNIKDDKYLSKKYFLMGALDFSVDFEKALIFTVKENRNGEISLRTDDNKHLKPKGEEFTLSSKERWFTISKKQNIENIDNFEETVEITKLHKEKEEKNNEEELLIANRFYDNKSENPLPINCTFTESRQKEHNFTSSKEFTWGASAKLSCSSIVGAEIGGQIEKKTITSNSITKTDNITIQETINPTCSPWKKMQVELRAKRSKISIPYTANVKRVINGRNYECLINGKYSCDNYHSSKCFPKEITTRNILLVGWTGSGKSTLAKVLSESDDFKESNQSVPGTKFSSSSKEFEWEKSQQKNYYCVIDNIGFGDTEIDEKEVMLRIGKAINSAYQGLSHVLFVFDGRFSDKEKEGYKKLAALKITSDYITLVRSKFDNFGNEKECNKDKESLEKESLEIRKLLNNCRGLLHIDNEDEDSRNDSRKKVLDYLHANCEEKPFKPKEWEDITSLIEDYFKEKEKLENEIKENIGQKEAVEQQIDNLKTDTAEKVGEKIKEGEEIGEFKAVIEIVNKK